MLSPWGPSGNIYVGLSSDAQTTYKEWIIMKLDPSGNMLWQRLLQGPSRPGSQLVDMAIDNSENVYICGNVSSTDMIFCAIAKYSSSGVIQWQ